MPLSAHNLTKVTFSHTADELTHNFLRIKYIGRHGEASTKPLRLTTIGTNFKYDAIQGELYPGMIFNYFERRMQGLWIDGSEYTPGIQDMDISSPYATFKWTSETSSGQTIGGYFIKFNSTTQDMSASLVECPDFDTSILRFGPNAITYRSVPKPSFMATYAKAKRIEVVTMCGNKSRQDHWSRGHFLYFYPPFDTRDQIGVYYLNKSHALMVHFEKTGIINWTFVAAMKPF